MIFLDQIGGLVDRRQHLAKRMAGPFGHFDTAGGQLAYFQSRHLAALRQFAHFGRHHREALAMFAGSRRFNGGVQGQQVGLVSNVIDDADALRDFFFIACTVC